MSNPLFVFAKFKAKKDKVSEMKALLNQFSHDTLRNENGCITYNYLQSREDETIFTSAEVWVNEKAEAAHWDTNHLKELLKVFPDVSEGDVEVTKYNRI
ncbi:putative quinol monooxygenase [Croceivirga radicis]|uniref:putative quinol monooxygenase n=1 Tax=Croceivirga radicis TaxID=1929488 RepID=UPI000255AFCC|nr:antibiotic biosynthesis monooxygenase [Croceivirga radicis]